MVLDLSAVRSFPSSTSAVPSEKRYVPGDTIKTCRFPVVTRIGICLSMSLASIKAAPFTMRTAVLDSSTESSTTCESSPILRNEPGFKSNSTRSEEHTSELQSRPHLVCRLLLEKKKKKQQNLSTQPLIPR